LRLKKEIKYLKNNNSKEIGKTADLDPAYKVLGFDNNEKFVDFCFENGINLKGSVDSVKLKKIKELKQQSEVKKKLKISNKMKTMSFKDLLNNQSEIGLTRDNKYYPYVKLFEKDEDKNTDFINFIDFIIEKINVFKKVNNSMFLTYLIDDYADGFRKVHDYKDFWLRDYREWTPTKYRNSWWNIVSFLEHLFEEYKLPKIFKTVWFNKNKKDCEIELYLDLCQGKSLHKTIKNYATNKKIPDLTKKQINCLMMAKGSDVFEVEYKKEYLIGNGVLKDFLRIASSGNWASSLNDLQLLKDYFLLIQNEAMLDKSQVMPLWDYVLHLRARTINEDKKFTLKNRSVQNLLNDMVLWHIELNKGNDNSYWPASVDVKPYIYEDLEKRTSSYYIEELTTAKDLVDEGKKLHHCVASYSGSCKKGYCSIWSFYKEEFGSVKKLITLEIRGGLNLVQSRGKANRLPNDSEWFHIEKWLQENGLRRGV